MEFVFETVYVNAHKLNIYLHIAAGSLATLFGLSQLLNQKGGSLHRRLGKLFFKSFSVVLATAVLGVLLFEFRAFLAVLTLSAAYTCLSGYRVFVLKGTPPRAIDNIVAGLSVAACFGFVFAIEIFQLSFSKATIYATLSGLTIVSTYDLSRNLFSIHFLKRTWLKEHAVKMISAMSALLSAASGNVLPSLGAIGQLAPVLACTILIIVYLFIPRIFVSKNSINVSKNV